jgi:hypothetical protein
LVPSLVPSKRSRCRVVVATWLFDDGDRGQEVCFTVDSRDSKSDDPRPRGKSDGARLRRLGVEKASRDLVSVVDSASLQSSS